MIKAIMNNNGRKLLILGLSANNLSLISDDRPVIVDLQALEQMTGQRVQDITIIKAETEEDLKAQLRDAIGETAWKDAEAAGRIRDLT